MDSTNQPKLNMDAIMSPEEHTISNFPSVPNNTPSVKPIDTNHQSLQDDCLVMTDDAFVEQNTNTDKLEDNTNTDKLEDNTNTDKLEDNNTDLSSDKDEHDIIKEFFTQLESSDTQTSVSSIDNSLKVVNHIKNKSAGEKIKTFYNHNKLYVTAAVSVAILSIAGGIMLHMRV
jgi:hypothetical protein